MLCLGCSVGLASGSQGLAKWFSGVIYVLFSLINGLNYSSRPLMITYEYKAEVMR